MTASRRLTGTPSSYVGQLATSPTPPLPPGGKPATAVPGQAPMAQMDTGKPAGPHVHPSPTIPPGAVSGTPEQERDPVCGMELGQGSDHGLTIKTDYQGKTYYFCSAQCKQEFTKDPQRYLNKTIDKIFAPPPPTPPGASTPPDLSKPPSPAPPP